MKPRLSAGHRALLEKVRGTVEVLIAHAKSYFGLRYDGTLSPWQPDARYLAKADSFLTSASLIAERAGILDEFVELQFYRAWISEWLHHPACHDCGAWRVDVEHWGSAESARCSKCADASGRAEAAE